MVKVVGKKEVTESIKLTPASAPSPEQGKIYFDSTSNKLKVSTDGTTFTEIPSPPNPSQGDILYYDGTNWVKLPAGTSGQYLKTQGEGANPTWADVDAGLSILSYNRTRVETTSTNWTTLHTHTFTPNTNRIIVFAWVSMALYDGLTSSDELDGHFDISCNGTSYFTNWTVGSQDWPEQYLQVKGFAGSATNRARTPIIFLMEIYEAGTHYTKGNSTTIEIKGRNHSSQTVEVCCLRSIVLGG